MAVIPDQEAEKSDPQMKNSSGHGSDARSAKKDIKQMTAQKKTTSARLRMNFVRSCCVIGLNWGGDSLDIFGLRCFVSSSRLVQQEYRAEHLPLTECSRRVRW